MANKKGHVGNPTGKGGFQDRPQDRSVGGVTREQWDKIKENRDKAMQVDGAWLDAILNLIAEAGDDASKVLALLSTDTRSVVHTAIERYDGKPSQRTDLTSSDGSMKPTTIQLVAPDNDDSG